MPRREPGRAGAIVGRFGRQAPRHAETAPLLRAVTARLDALALGSALGIVSGALLFVATILLVLRGGASVGPHLSLLGQYLPGYHVTVTGGVLGAAYGLVGGFLLGWLTAYLRNACLVGYLWAIRLWANLSQAHFLDRVD